MTSSLLKNDVVELKAADTSLIISGAPGFDSASALANAGIRWIERVDSHSISFDVTEVKAANSGVLCVLLEWLRAAAQRNIGIDAVALPPRLEALVRISDLGAVFKPSSADA